MTRGKLCDCGARKVRDAKTCRKCWRERRDPSGPGPSVFVVGKRKVRAGDQAGEGRYS